MKKWIIISTLIGIALFISVFFRLGLGDVIETFKKANFIYLIPYLIFFIAIFIGIQYRLKIILKAHGFSISLLKLLPIGFSGFAVSYLTPSAQVGGEPVRAYLLSKQGMKYSKALASAVIDKSLELSVNAFFAFVGLILFLLKFALPRKAEIVISFSIVLLIVFLFVLYYRLARGLGFFSELFRILGFNRIKYKHILKIEKTILDMESHITKFFKHKTKTLILTLLLSLFLWICMFLEYKLALLMFGLDASFYVIFLVITVVGIAYIFPIPAALGVLEVGQASLFAIIGLPVSIGVAASILLRARDLTWTFLGLINLFLHGFKRK
ncbi:MAG: lysylphosphatidylglycerol synthase transmembrane domain-containing protein [Candidatus Woesearchaeota archaeon]|nr:lysylphosphatidylglycerol synthase transmembrane domain-containing protein [Candidatus Woesearchaeota archaeon]